MYLDYWKLARRPFDERIDPTWFFASGVHRGVRLQMRTVIEQKKPVALLVGAVGSGKSMVAASVADRFTESQLPIPLCINPITARDTLQGILDELHHSTFATADRRPQPPAENPQHRDSMARPKLTGSSGNRTDEQQRPKATSDRAAISPECVEPIQRLKGQLGPRRQAGQHAVAFLDAADGMPDSELRKVMCILREFTVDDVPAMTAFIIGSPDLLVRARRLARDFERLFPQCVLGPMSPTDTALYVRHRMQRAAGDPAVFSPASIELIHDLSGGLPRRINRLCDLCLLVGFSKNCEMITEGLVWTAQREVCVLAPSRTAVAAPTRRWRPLARRLSLRGHSCQNGSE